MKQFDKEKCRENINISKTWDNISYQISETFLSYWVRRKSFHCNNAMRNEDFKNQL